MESDLAPPALLLVQLQPYREVLFWRDQGLIDSYLLLKGMFSLHPLHYSLLIFLFCGSFLVTWCVLSSWTGQLALV